MTKKIKSTMPPKQEPMNESAHVQTPLTHAQDSKQQTDHTIDEVVFVHAVVFRTGLSFLCLNAKHPNNLRWNIKFVIKNNFLYIFSDKEFCEKTVVVPLTNVKQMNCSDEGLSPERV